MKRLLVSLAGIAFLSSGFAAGLLPNSSFEETLPVKKGRWQVELLKEWGCNLNSGTEKCDITIAQPGFSGKNAVKLHTIGKAGFCSVDANKVFSVSEGQTVTASVMMRGKGNGYIRIYFHDAGGKYLKQYKMLGRSATENWEKLLLKFTVPAGVAKIRYSLQTLRDDAEVLFDDAELVIDAGDVLENAALRAIFNPRLGGCVDSFTWKEKKFEFTTPNRLGVPGGMFSVVLPAERMPGEIYTCRMERVEAPAALRVYRTQLANGKFQGLEITKSYQLLADGLQLTLKLRNNGKAPMKLTGRVQNFVSSAPGTYSWPTPDWVTIFRQTGAPRNGLNAVVQDLFRAGWEAKYYHALEAALCFRFDAAKTRRLYCYFSTEPACSTMEWYLKEFTLEPGGEFSQSFTAQVLPGKADYYADAHGRTQRVEKVEPIKLPPPPKSAGLPPSLRGFFPFSAGLGNLHQPEMAGQKTNIGFYKQHKILNVRMTKILTDSYFNAVCPGRMNQESALAAFKEKDGSNCIGEMARKYRIKIFFGHLFSRRDDVDVNKYMKDKWPEEVKWVNNPEFQEFVRKYSDVLPLHFTGDELLPQNVDVLLKIHEELKKYLPENTVPFPYLNSSSTDFIPYVPVFLGDWYPIKRAKASGRNPWSVYPEFSRIVRIAGDKPVWFMPQGFSDGPGYKDGIYAFPSAGEMRLMLHLAAAAGVKGIAWHGFASGTWTWMMNYHMYRYSAIGGAGQETPTWCGVVDAARTFATVGPLLLQGTPGALPAGIRLETRKYRSPNGFYEGDAIRLYTLKLPEGTLVIAVNQNPDAEEKGEITFPAGMKVFRADELLSVSGTMARLKLAPGDAAYFYCNGSQKLIDAVYLSRFRAERARYLLLAEVAAGAGIKGIEPDELLKQPPEQALRQLFLEYIKLQKQLNDTELGRIIAEMKAMQKILDALDFRLCCARELVVTPEMWQQTRRYGRWVKHPDARYQALRERAAAAFADFYRLQDAIRAGKGVGNTAAELPALHKEIKEVSNQINGWLDHHPERSKIDDPYGN